MRREATYDLIVCTAGVVGPGGLLHDAASNGLKVHQVVAGGQRRHAVDALLALHLLGIGGLFLLFDGGHVDFTKMLGLIEVFVKGVWGVDGVELLGRILAGILEDNLLATGVLWILSVTIQGRRGSKVSTWEELGHIVGLAVNNDPAGVLGVVFGDGGAGELAFTHGGEWSVGRIMVREGLTRHKGEEREKRERERERWVDK